MAIPLTPPTFKNQPHPTFPNLYRTLPVRWNQTDPNNPIETGWVWAQIESQVVPGTVSVSGGGGGDASNADVVALQQAVQQLQSQLATVSSTATGAATQANAIGSNLVTLGDVVNSEAVLNQQQQAAIDALEMDGYTPVGPGNRGRLVYEVIDNRVYSAIAIPGSEDYDKPLSDTTADENWVLGHSGEILDWHGAISHLYPPRQRVAVWDDVTNKWLGFVAKDVTTKAGRLINPTSVSNVAYWPE